MTSSQVKSVRFSQEMEIHSDSNRSQQANFDQLRLNLHSLEVYFKDGRSARLLKSSHDRNFFSNDEWMLVRKRAVGFLKKDVKAGEARAFRLGRENEFGCHMISWTNGLSAICITSRSDNFIPITDDSVTRTCLTAEGRLLTRVLDNCIRKLPAEMWALETRVLVDDQRIKYYEGHLNLILQEEMDNLYKKTVSMSKEWAKRQKRYQQEFERRQGNISSSTLLKKKIVKWVEARA